MTVTQACRFRELQSTRSKARPHYSLKEGARLLRSEVDEILLAAAARRLQCVVLSTGLRGHWRRARRNGSPVLPEHIGMPKYLALSPADCRKIATYGRVNVYELEYPAASTPDNAGIAPAIARFILREPLWVGPGQLMLKHPLPK